MGLGVWGGCGVGCWWGQRGLNLFALNPTALNLHALNPPPLSLPLSLGGREGRYCKGYFVFNLLSSLNKNAWRRSIFRLLQAFTLRLTRYQITTLSRSALNACATAGQLNVFAKLLKWAIGPWTRNLGGEWESVSNPLISAASRVISRQLWA